MECGAQCSVPKSRQALATIRHANFDITPLESGTICTASSVAAHTLYEKSRPDFQYGPDGMLDLTKATYTELPDGCSVRVQGSSYTQSTPETKWTIKLEGAKAEGYHSMFVGGCADPILISQIDVLLQRVKDYVASKCAFQHELKLTVYGKEHALDMLGKADHSGVTGLQSHSRPQPATIGILGQARASTQREANMVVAMARIACVHGPYPHQKATSGNFGMPTAPQEIPMGQVSEFNIYHLMTVDDPAEHFQIKVHTSVGSGKCKGVDKSVGPGAMKSAAPATASSNMKDDFSKPMKNYPKPFQFQPDQLGALASVIRAKNAGPFEVTFDVMFSSLSTYNTVKASGVLTKSTIAKLYNLEESDVVTCMFWDQALAFKATVARKPIVSGGWGEVDMHSSTQHAKLMELHIPSGMSQKLLSRSVSDSTASSSYAEWLVGSPLGLATIVTALSLSVLARQKYPAIIAQFLSPKRNA